MSPAAYFALEQLPGALCCTWCVYQLIRGMQCAYYIYTGKVPDAEDDDERR